MPVLEDSGLSRSNSDAEGRRRAARATQKDAENCNTVNPRSSNDEGPSVMES